MWIFICIIVCVCGCEYVYDRGCGYGCVYYVGLGECERDMDEWIDIWRIIK